MNPVTNTYIDLWIDQAEREQKRNPGNHASVDLDSWLAILRELRALRRRRWQRPKP